MPHPAASLVGLVGPAYNIGKDTYNAAKPHYNYVKDIHKNFRKLDSEIRSLRKLKKDVEGDLERNSNAMIMSHQCRHWFDNVGKINESFTVLHEKYRRTNNSLFDLWKFPKLRKLGKTIVKLTNEVIQRKEDRRHLNVMVEKPSRRVELGRSTNVIELDSQANKVKELLDHLRDVNVKRIGLFGLGGIGKTTIMEKLHKKVTKKPEFGMTFFISVPGGHSSRHVQEDLLRQLKLPITDTNSTEQVADIISEKIENEKYLLLLDQVSSVISLDAIGIRNCHKHGKVVIASNQKKTCRDMGANEFLIVEHMSSDDADKLFEAILDDDTIGPRLKIMAKQIVKKLTMPGTINLVAVTLKREKEENKWNNILQAVNYPIDHEQHDFEDLDKMFTNIINQLPFILRRCLFYASLFPSQYEIHKDYLVECWINESFISRDSTVDQPFRDSRVDGLGTLDDLMERSLLQRCHNKLKYIRMPEQIRKLSLEAIVELDGSKPLVVTSQQRQVENWEHAKRMSLMCNNFNKLTQRPTNCSDTLTLLLQKNSELKHISNSFFAHMRRLQVLDLYTASIDSLPQSLFDLISLQGLYLNHCKQLTSLPSKIEKLKNLKLLDIRYTGIHSLPKAIGKLSELICFRVSLLNNGVESSSNNLSKKLIKRKEVLIPKNLIKKLSKLEELTIIVDPKERSWNAIAGQIVEEIASLEVLTTLHFYFPGVASFVDFVKTSKSWNHETEKWAGNTFRSYKMFVGYGGVNKKQNLDHAERLLRFCSGEDVPSEIMIVLKQASAFELIGHSKVQSLVEFGVENLKGLEVCVIEDCNKMESVIHCNHGIDGIVFPALKELHIRNLPKLDSIWKGKMVKESMVKITTLTLKECPMLTTILTPEVAQQLKQLKSLRVENCSRVVLIIGSPPLISNGAGNHSQAPKINETENPSADLEKVEAQDEKVVSENQSKVHDIIVAQKGSRVQENIIAQNQPRFGEQNNSRTSKIKVDEHEMIVTLKQSMICEAVRVEKHSRTDEIIEARKHSRVSEIIEVGHEMIVPPSQSRINEIVEAQNHLRVSEIVEEESDSRTAKTENIAGTVRIENLAGALPKLEKLELVNLPLLSAICQSDVLSWLALENIEIQKCPNFKKLSSITMDSEELSIKCTNSFWEAQIWPDDHLRQRLQLLCNFIPDESPNNPSSSSMVASSPTS